MIGEYVLKVDGSVDTIRRLHQDPPVPGWDETTAWTVHAGPGGKALLESAIIECPDCGDRAYWRNGQIRCEGCEKQRLIG